MKDKLNDLLRHVAKSSCTPQEFEAIAMRIEDIKKEFSIYGKSTYKEDKTGGGNGELWEKELFESSLRPVLKKYPTSDDFIIAANQSDNAPVKL